VAKQHQRKAIVFVSLMGVLTLTTTLLLAMAPAPLAPGAQATLFNAQSTPSGSLDTVFATDKPIQRGYWSGILIHHSRTPAGDARSLAHPELGVGDHFVIGNGDGAVDGQIEISARWMAQTGALAPQGSASMDRRCISICLVGDFDQSAPTRLQLQRAAALVSTLQNQLNIPADRIWTLKTRASAAGIGANFPDGEFRRLLTR
jgi:hypothetical protein